MRIRLLPMFLPLFLAGSTYVFSEPVQANFPCFEVMQGQTLSGGFASPYSVGTGLLYPLIMGQCSRKGLAVEAGNWEHTTLVYRQGYAYHNGAWESFEFQGGKPAGEWFVGHASARLARSEEELREHNFVAAFVCQYVGHGSTASWKCGCTDRACQTPAWQLQSFSMGSRPAAMLEYPIMPEISEVVIGFVSHLAAEAGETVSIEGHGFSESGNKVFLGEHLVATVPALQSGRQLFFKAPPLPYGRYALRVENQSGKSTGAFWLVIKDPRAKPPVIERIEPKQGPWGSTVTIFGKNFSEENEVFTRGERLSGATSSDGTSMTVVLKPFSKLGVNTESIRQAPIPNRQGGMAVPLWIVNGYGVSAEPAIFSLSL